MSKDLIRGYLLGCRAPKEIMDALDRLLDKPNIPLGNYEFLSMPPIHPNCRCIYDPVFAGTLKKKTKKKKAK